MILTLPTQKPQRSEHAKGFEYTNTMPMTCPSSFIHLPSTTWPLLKENSRLALYLASHSSPCPCPSFSSSPSLPLLIPFFPFFIFREKIVTQSWRVFIVWWVVLGQSRQRLILWFQVKEWIKHGMPDYSTSTCSPGIFKADCGLFLIFIVYWTDSKTQIKTNNFQVTSVTEMFCRKA